MKSKNNNSQASEKDSQEIEHRHERAEGLGTIINKLVGDSEIGKKIKRYNIFNHWSDIVGIEIGKKTKPEKLYKGLLYISVANSTWANELSLMTEQLIKKINTYIGEPLVKGIRFKLQ
jgi:predicted nucleic acid-binding Zn ribbon protein